MSNEAFDKFLLKLFEKTANKGQKFFFNKYEIGKEIGIFNPSEVDRIVEILEGDGYVLTIKSAEIRITDKGKERLEHNQI
jgi:Mn-dependent DtxR family transcriptional regulator